MIFALFGAIGAQKAPLLVIIFFLLTIFHQLRPLLSYRLDALFGVVNLQHRFFHRAHTVARAVDDDVDALAVGCFHAVGCQPIVRRAAHGQGMAGGRTALGEYHGGRLADDLVDDVSILQCPFVVQSQHGTDAASLLGAFNDAVLNNNAGRRIRSLESRYSSARALPVYNHCIAKYPL